MVVMMAAGVAVGLRLAHISSRARDRDSLAQLNARARQVALVVSAAATVFLLACSAGARWAIAVALYVIGSAAG